MLQNYPIQESNHLEKCWDFKLFFFAAQKINSYINAVRFLGFMELPAIFFLTGLFFIIFSYFGSFMVVWGFGVGVLYWDFGVGFSVDWVWGLWCGSFWVFWVGALYINIKE